MIGLGGIFVLYYVGKAFYTLADNHQKSKWGFAVLGVLSYYGGIFFGGLIIGIVYELFLEKSVEEVSDIVLTLMALPVGILCCWGFYKILDRQWSKPKTLSVPDDVLDANFINQHAGESHKI